MRRNLPCFAILVTYILCIIAANPIGEFPLNDDWSYARSAFAFSAGRGLRVDPWAAPSVVGQALYGGLLARLFSPSFTVLRASTLALSCCTILLFWGILLRAGIRKDLACIMLLAWAFNPLQFNLSFTYMTEIPFLFLAALALYLYSRHLETGRLPFLILSSAALGYAFLIRQTALLFVLALAASLLLDRNAGLRIRIRRLVSVLAVTGAFIGGYYLWSHLGGGATAAVQRKFALLSHIKTKQIVGNSYGMVFYLSFMLLPVWIFLISSAFRLMREFRRRIQVGICVLCGGIVVAGLAWFYGNYRPAEYLPAASYHARMPYLLNVLYDTGLGPLTLDPDYFAVLPTPVYPAVWWGITGIAATGAAFCSILLIFGAIRFRKVPSNGIRVPLAVFAGAAFLILAGFEIVFSHLQEGGLFDRHILIVSFPLLLLTGVLSGNSNFDNVQRLSRVAVREEHTMRLFATCITIAVMAWFCVAGTHDYMEWNRIRWQMGRGLLAQGVDPLAIVGGFEFNAWNNYDTFVARGRTAQTSHWWYDRRDYVITMTPLEGYQIRERRSYFSWIHFRPVDLYLLSAHG